MTMKQCNDEMKHSLLHERTSILMASGYSGDRFCINFLWGSFKDQNVY